MAQCQTNPDGRCTMEPPCLPGECYLYSVAMKMHAESAGELSEDQDVARELIVGTLAYLRGPYTENEPWDRNKLALVNALLDTLVPGARLVVEKDGEGPARVTLGRTNVWPRPRNLPHSLRELADCLDGRQSVLTSK